MTHEDKRMINELQKTYKLSLNKESMARSLSVNEVEEIAQGRLWIGKTTVNNKLISCNIGTES